MPRYYKHSDSLCPTSHYMVQNRAWRMPHMGTTPADLQVHACRGCMDEYAVRHLFNPPSIHISGHLIDNTVYFPSASYPDD